MTLLLSLETSTTNCSAALHEDGRLLAASELHIAQSTASQLAIMIDHLFATTGKKKAELSVVVVSAGPGSYTGLRIGVATGKGICYALNIPLIAVNTLELLAYQVKRAGVSIDGLLCPMLDARRMEVYCLLADANLEVKELTQAKIIDETSFVEELTAGPVLFFGDGADKCKAAIRHGNASFLDGVIPSATALGELGYERWNVGAFEDLATYEPFYLKDFVIKKPNPVS